MAASQTAKPPPKPKTPNPQKPTGVSSHLLMVELKQKILNSLNKLSDRDTQQIAIEDLEMIIETLMPEGIPMFLNCLYDTDHQQKVVVRKECIRLLGVLATFHGDSVSTHLTKIITHIVRRLKDPDSGVREACNGVMGVLAGRYLQGEGAGAVAGLFVRPLMEALGEQGKAVQAGAAMCLARVVESGGGEVVAFQKLCPRIAKLLGNQNFVAKGALLGVISSLSQVGALAPQSLPVLLPCIHECLESSDWANRKAAADTLINLAAYSRNLVLEGAPSTITALEACRFDKVKPVRDSMTEALQLWKNIAGKGGDGTSEEPKPMSPDGDKSKLIESVEKLGIEKSSSNSIKSESSAKDTSKSSSPPKDSHSKPQANSSISDKAVGILKKKAPILNDKEINPEFFQKLETRNSDDLPVEVVVPRNCLNSSKIRGEEESKLKNSDCGNGSGNNGMPSGEINGTHGSIATTHLNTNRKAGPYNKQEVSDDFANDKWLEQRFHRVKDSKPRTLDSDDRADSQRELGGSRLNFSRADGYSDGSLNSKGNWLGIQRQLVLLERQQTNLMKMLQDFMGGSHDSMVTLETRVRGLERIVEDMAHELGTSSGRRGMMLGFEGPTARSLGKYGPSDFTGSKLGRGGDGRISFSDRFSSSDGIRGRDPPWDSWDSYPYGAPRNGHLGSRRVMGSASNDCRIPRMENEGDQLGNNRRGWERGPGPTARLGEGPSARSVWQASKDEATLEAIRVAGEDGGTSRTNARVAIPELDSENIGDDNIGQEKGPLWASWSHAMDSLHAGDVDSAYAEVLSTGDDILLVKLMDRSGPMIDQLSNEIAIEVLHAAGQLLHEQSFLDIGLSWIQQLLDLVVDNGADYLGIPFEEKRGLLFSLYEASELEMPEDWEGASPDELIMQLAAAWGIDLQQFDK
ncbi:hypothetical protein AMTRI_Chr02g257080 [Amborella trichopoda]